MSLQQTLKKILPVDRSIEPEAHRRLDQLTKPQGSLGKLEELALHVACIQGENPPRVGQKLIFIFAADHGIVGIFQVVGEVGVLDRQPGLGARPRGARGGFIPEAFHEFPVAGFPCRRPLPGSPKGVLIEHGRAP